MPASFGSFSVFKQDGIRQFYCRWTPKEDDLLIDAVKKYGCHRWSLIAQTIPGRTPAQCSTRWHGALNTKVHKGRWSADEDKVLLEAVKSYQNDNNNTMPWNDIAQHIPNRTGIQCQSRWTEALDPAVRKGRWTKDEDASLRQAVSQVGCCWIRVAGCIPSRTQRQCRTRWNQIKNTRRSTKEPTPIPAMIIPASDYSVPITESSITIPKDPFHFLLDHHHLPSSFLTTPGLSNHLDAWFYGH
ncbi:Homeodomain-like protein [Chlamydoabsidia padenii]|nr:Homeodomain-like protein [Chlamydoabsidia padenii]